MVMVKINTPLFLLAIVSLLSTDCTNNTPNIGNDMTFKKIDVTYPFSKKDTTVSDTYFGVEVKDPYRWLEDDQSEETKDWVQKQNIVTNGYLSQIPFREKIFKRLEKMWNFEKFGVPFEESEKYYFFKNDGLQNQSVLYVQETLESEASVVLDPNSFSKDGTASLQEMGFSKDGNYLAYGISEGGSDWRTIRIKDLKNGTLLEDEVKFAKFTGIAWEGAGFYYSRYPQPKEGDQLKGANQNSAIYFHQLGTPQDQDLLVYKDPKHPNYYFGLATTEDERFAILTASESTSGNSLAFKNLTKKEKSFQTVVEGFSNDFSVIDNLENDLLVLTNQKAPNGRLILIHTDRPKESAWETLIPENPSDVLSSASICGDKIICQYLHNASSVLRVYDLKGQFIKEIALPEIGTVGSVSGKKGKNVAFYSFQSFLRPNTIYRLDLTTLESSVFKAPKVDFDPDAFMTEQVWFESKDGTKVPMFISRKKNMKMDGTNPTLLYGYGGFNISLTPTFSVSKAALLENNGVYVVANIRGGGEFGEKWHKAGTVLQKQNVFDDFIAAATYLVEQKYTAPERLAIEGGSNGGLLIGACMTQRPDLFGVCFPRVGVLDMLRYHQFTIGYAWAVDYGRSDANEAEFKNLLSYSPLHNVKKQAYPSTMVMTADHDDRVVPAHSFKFAATLQEHQTGERPILARIDTSAGHGAGKPTDKVLAEAADMLAFLLYEMKSKVVY